MDNAVTYVPTSERVDRAKVPRKAVLERDEHQCCKCSRCDGLEVHHIKPVSEGGTNDLGNLITLCGACHTEWHSVEKASKITTDHWLKYPPVHRLIVMLDTMKDCGFIDKTILEQILGVLCLK